MNLSDYEPIGNQVLCEAYIAEKTESGLLIPVESRKKTRIMTVIKKGSGCENNIRPGDKVILGDVTRTVELKFGKIDYVQVPEYALIGFLRVEATKKPAKAKVSKS
jgi:co-chaperonin GroES (HSP10)